MDARAKARAAFEQAVSELLVLRREIDEVIARGACRDEATASCYHRRLEAARAKVFHLRAELRKLDG